MSDMIQKFNLGSWRESNLISRVGLRTGLFVGVCAIGGIAWVIYYLTEDEDNEFKIHKTSRHVVIQVEVKREDIGMIIGRAGSNLKNIEKQTDTRITFNEQKDDNNPVRILSIRGSKDSVHNAENLIYSQINSKPVLETEEICIPTVAVGRVIGKVGTSIKEISKKSNAKVTIDNSKSRTDKTKVTICGTLEQIALAKELINTKVEEYEEVKAKMNEGISKRSPFRSSRTRQLPSVNPLVSENTVSREKLVSTSSDGSLTVFMSAVINPEKFWVQIMNDRAVELDQLVESMTDFYNQTSKQEMHRLKGVNIGQVVAVLLNIDQKWYRAQVTAVNQLTDGDAVVELYFVDYGDSVTVPLGSVFSLNPDFLSLCFQAIECRLAFVKPNGESWSEEAISCFEDLTHLAQWKPLVARVESYQECSRSGSPPPCVSLFDTSGGERDVNISKELISRGHGLSTRAATDLNSSSDSDTLVENATTSGVCRNPPPAKTAGNNLLGNNPNPRSPSKSERPASVVSYASSQSSSNPGVASSNPGVASSMPNVSKGGEKKKRKF